MLNIVVPMAGLGSRFAKAGFALPKPLIPVHSVPMIQLVIANITPAVPHRFIFICQNQHIAEYDLRTKLANWAPGCETIGIDGQTDGAACTVLAARTLIDDTSPLMIANSDQFVDCEIDDYLDDISGRGLDGLIMTMWADDPKWSYAAINAQGHATEVVEKQVISNHATVGIYNFRSGRAFVAAADAMIAADLRVNGEFYVAPVYNQMIAAGARIGVHDIGSVGAGMYGLGIPSDLEAFLALPLSHDAVARVTA